MTTPLTGSASDYFGAMVREYDSLIRRAVPRYDEMMDVLERFLPDRSPSRIVELGCGTGTLTLRLARRYPNARITIVDASPEMIDTTRHRLVELDARWAERATFIISRFEDLTLEPESFDLITSCISLHHVKDKAPLFARFYDWLAPDGTLRFADQSRGVTEEHHEKIWSDWQAFCRQLNHCSEEELQSLIDHAEAHDHYEPLTDHLRYIDDAGFPRDRVDVVWRNLLWTIILADKL